MSQSLLLPAFYLPNISYFHVIKKHESPLLIEQYEHYPKQTFRTRTQISTANSVLDLIVPIIHGRRERQAIKDIRINYDHPWQRLHWLSIQNAYRNSAYFEFYEDDFSFFYEKKFEFLFDFNMEQLRLILKLLKIDRSIEITQEYSKESLNEIDFRTEIHPKKTSLNKNVIPYYQLFQENRGFIENLSIIDLLFSQGPQSKNYF